MGFFDEVMVTGRRTAAPERQTVQPAHIGPPEGWVLPTVLPAVRVLGQSPNARIALVGLLCWPDGVTLDIRLMCRERRFGGSSSDDWAFRLGVRYADRRRVAAHEFPVQETAHEPAENGLVLRPTIGGGGRFHRHWQFYLWPLPPKGRLTLVADWPSELIPETYTELDAGEIRSAAARSVVVWRDLPSSEVSRNGGPQGRAPSSIQ
jgi:hypothetical protein